MTTAQAAWDRRRKAEGRSRPTTSDALLGGDPGPSATARAFGASVAVDRPEGASLFFVVGRAGPPDAVLRAYGGSVVTRLPDPRRVLALLPLAAYSDLVRRPELASAGPVGIDRERFGAFARLIGLDEQTDPARPP